LLFFFKCFAFFILKKNAPKKLFAFMFKKRFAFFFQNALFNILICSGPRIERRKLGRAEERLGDVHSPSVQLQEPISNGDILPLEWRRNRSTQASWRDDRRPADERVAKS
jgi:hypothetical protein